jgi:hypothetical protein
MPILLGDRPHKEFTKLYQTYASANATIERRPVGAVVGRTVIGEWSIGVLGCATDLLEECGAGFVHPFDGLVWLSVMLSASASRAEKLAWDFR